MRKPIKSTLETVKVTFDNGDVMYTDYNADVGREEIARYYYGKIFNTGSYPKEEMHKVVKVEFPNSEGIFENYKPITSARFLIEDENGEVLAEADTYEEAQTVNGAKIIDTKSTTQKEGGLFQSKKVIKSSVGTYDYNFFYNNLKDNPAFEEYRVRFDDDPGEDNIHTNDNISLKMTTPNGKVYSQPRNNYLQFWYSGWRFSIGNLFYTMKYSEIENATITGNKLVIDVNNGTHLEFGLDGTISNSHKTIKSDYDIDKVWEIADRYNGSRPLSGDWNTETEHQLNATAKELGISKQEAKQLMIDELGFPEEEFEGINCSLEEQEEGRLFSNKQIIQSSNDFGFHLTTYPLGDKLVPYSLEDAYGNTYNLLDFMKPYSSYEEWEEDVKQCFDPNYCSMLPGTETFLEDHPGYIDALYEFEDQIHKQYYGTDLIANSYDMPTDVSSHRQSKDPYTLNKIVSGVMSGNITEEKAIQQLCVMNNCNTGYAKTLLNNYIKSGIMDIADEINQDFDVDGDLSSWFKDYVPNSGKANTIGGELVRAANQIINRYNNDGDMIGRGYGKETCNPAARYILNVATDFDGNDKIERLVENTENAVDYDAFINEFEEDFTDYLRDHEEFFHAPNKDAYEDYKEDNDKDTSVDECYIEDNGIEYWFQKVDDGWKCTGYGDTESEYDVGDVFDDNDDISDEISEKTDEYYDFIKDGWSYSVEAYDEVDEGEEHHEWEVTDVSPQEAAFFKDDVVDTDDLLDYDVYDMNGMLLEERDLY